MIILYYLLAIGCGIGVGIFTGLTPGIHINVVASLMVTTNVFMGDNSDLTLPIAVFIVAVSITHNFFDYIPTLFLGIPASEVYALLPGQKLIKSGDGGKALKLSIEGSWRGIISAFIIALTCIVLMMVINVNVLAQLEGFIRPILFWVLLVICCILISSEKNIKWAISIFLLSGLFGIIVLGSPLVPGGSFATFGVLFPALSGLFGISGLFLSLTDNTARIPEQKNDISLTLENTKINFWTGIGTLAGMMVGLLPGLGAANAAALTLLLTRNKEKESNDKSYIVTTSAIQASDALFGITALYFINRSRSGASVAINSILGGINIQQVFVIILTMVITGFISRFIVLNSWQFLLKKINKLNYRSLTVATIGFITLLVFFTTGFWGLLILLGGASLGILTPTVNVRRSQMMGFFLIPVILFYSGFQEIFVTFFHLQAKLSPPQPLSFTEISAMFLITIICSIITYFINKKISRKY